MTEKVETYDQVSASPTNKVAAAGIGGTLSVVLLWLVTQIWPSLRIPPEVAGAISTLISFGSGYLIKEKRVVDAKEKK